MKDSQLVALFGLVWSIVFWATDGMEALILSGIFFAAAFICRAIEARK